MRIETVQRLVDALNSDHLPSVPVLGSLGQADLAPLSHLVFGILGDEALSPGRGGRPDKYQCVLDGPRDARTA